MHYIAKRKKQIKFKEFFTFRVRMYLNTDKFCIILAADQKTSSSYEYWLKVHILSFNLRVFSSKLEVMVKEITAL